MRSKQPKTAA
jgi:hypothetical protein